MTVPTPIAGAVPLAVGPWHDNIAGAPGAAPAPAVLEARELLVAALADDGLRRLAAELADGVDWSRLDDHHVLDHVAAGIAHGRLRARAPAAPRLLRLVPVLAPAPPPAAAQAAASRPVEHTAAPPPAETTFGSAVDVAAMVAVLTQAAQTGVPFCEECAKAATARAAASEAPA